MREGKKLKEAILEVYGDVDFETSCLRNWVIEKHFRSYESLVLKIKEKYLIKEVVFEIDYNLKKGNKQRKSASRNARKIKKTKETNPDLSQYQLLKLRLWEECDYSLYEGKTITKGDVLSEKYNIDHIIPKSKYFDFSFNNMILSPKKLNTQKGNSVTAIEFAETLGLSNDFLEKINLFSDNKKERLLSRTNEIKGGTLASIRNGDYNTKCFATVCKANNIPNKIIGLYGRQHDLPNYASDDIRYALVKAFAMANISENDIERIDNIHVNGAGYSIEEKINKIDFENTPVFLQRIKHTKKIEGKYTPRFALHEETVYGKTSEDKYFIRKPIISLSEAMIKKIIDNDIKKELLKKIAKAGGWAKYKESYDENPIVIAGNTVKSVKIRVKSDKIRPIHSASDGETGNYSLSEKKVDYVYLANHRLITLNTNGKRIDKTILPLIDFIGKLNKSQPIAVEGMCLTKNDIIEINNKRYFVIGVAEDIKIRSVYTMNSVDTAIRLPKEFTRLMVNELGDVVGSEKFKM